MKSFYMGFDVKKHPDFFTNLENCSSFKWSEYNLESKNLNELIRGIRFIFKKTGVLPVLNVNMNHKDWRKIEREISNLDLYSVMIGKKRLMPFELN